MNEINELSFLCECSSAEHQFIIRYFEDEYPEIYMSVHLTKRSFWARLKHGIKYIFGYKSVYGAFDEFIMNEKHIKPLEKVVEHLKKVEAARLQTKLFDEKNSN